MSTFILDGNNSAIEKAITLAQELSRHCKEHNLPKSLIICGVAPDACAVVLDAREELVREIVKGIISVENNGWS